MARATIETVLAIFPCLLSVLVHLDSNSSFTYNQLLAGTLEQNLGWGGLSSVLLYPCLVPDGAFLGLASC